MRREYQPAESYLPSVGEMVEWASKIDGGLLVLVQLCAKPETPTAVRVRYQGAIRVLIHRAVRAFDFQTSRPSRSGILRLDRVYDDRMQRVAANLTPGNWTGD